MSCFRVSHTFANMNPNTKRFSFKPTITSSDIDVLNHVNNEVYLRWLLEAAIAHSAAVGYPMAKFVDMGAAFVVRRHELDYKLPIFLGDDVRVETWTEAFEGSRGIRHYELINEKTGKTALVGKTLWVFVDLKNGRPTEIPHEILADFGHA